MERTWHIRICGIVQAVGFRPFVSRTADRLGLRGSVANRGSFVEVFLQGEEEAVKRFLAVLETDPPVRSSILRTEVKELEKEKMDSFQILESGKEAGEVFVSPDIATCPSCRRELYDPSDRRYLHPFINCTSCGPRLTILESMPYDRDRTTMKEFPMCENCRREYVSPETRRYDAQPVCCNGCGPQVYLIGGPERGLEAIQTVRKSIMEGKLVAVKGIGGFHLCCDGRNDSAVKELRKRKNRPRKPFAVMMRDPETVRKYCFLSPEEEMILDGHQKPILLLKKRPGSSLPESLAPGNPFLGVMLPYAPVQMLLFDCGEARNRELDFTDVLVMTSGNVSGAPICRNDEDAVKEIGAFCDLILSHDRKILLRADDSVMDFYHGAPYMIRRSRGYAPLPFLLSGEWKGGVLGIGGELKNTFCIGKNSLFYPSSYIGDMGDVRSVNALKESVKRLATLLETEITLVCCDLHPRYNSAAAAEEMLLPLHRVQHHYAHILSCMAENDFLSPVIGISFDGTGYGPDGTIWGGEILSCSLEGFSRLGHIAPFPQPGGDASSREGWRIGAAFLYSLYGAEEGEKTAMKLALCTEKEFRTVAFMTEKKINTVVSTSCGRLFDAASAILGLRKSSSFEGEAAMDLEFAAMRKGCSGEGEFSPGIREEKGKTVLDTLSLVKRVVEGQLAGEDRERTAWEFHASLARLIAQGCEKAREKTGLEVCALSGGVFQNLLLLELCQKELEKRSFRVLRHSLIPPNDGGIALGQALSGMVHLNGTGKTNR
ncbi:MAG: carbamoyltransferase HypF [Lentisphaeria bacterium]|nr:carbamoyltransferase HypF [Lentisphaeria bacterium]